MRTTTSIIALSVFAAGPVLAQEALELDPIVISAGKSKIASDTPQAVSVVDQDDINGEQATTVGDVLTDLPGVKSFGTERVLGERFNIRGFGRDLDGGDENRIILQVNGVTKFYQQYRLGALFTDPELYKRVEVLRGPASSTLYGSGALGGVITFETKEASDFLEDDDAFSITQKRELTDNGAGFMTSSILAGRPTNNTEILGAFVYRQNEDVVDGNGDEIAGSGFEAPSALLDAGVFFGDGDAAKVSGFFQYWTTQEDGAEYEQTTTNAGFGTVNRLVTDLTTALTFEFAPADKPLWDLEAQVSYSDTSVTQEDSSLEGAPLFGGRPSVLFDNSDYAYQQYELSLENTSLIDLSGVETFLTYGISGSEQTRTGEAEVGGTVPNGFISFQPGGTERRYALFTQAEIIFPFGLTVIPGVRWETSELKPDELNTSFTETKTEEAFSPKLAALFEFTDSLGVFGSIARTERLPVLDEVFDGNSGNLRLKPEQALNYEAGVSFSQQRLLAEDDELVVKATVFHNEVDDLIDRASTRDPFLNVGEATIEGFELEADYDVGFAFGSLAYSVTRGEGREQPGDPIEPLNSIPADELAFTLGGRIQHQDLEFGVRGVLAADQDRVADADDKTGGYAVFDLFASWKPEQGFFENGEIRFGIENVLDRAYQEHLSNDLSTGRAFTLTVKKTF